MANVAHAALTGASLHEPKGVASADVGTVYVADGAGSGSWSTLSTNVLIGSIMDYAGTTVPPGSGWLLCYGQEISRVTYAALFAAIGTLFGIGDGVTTFRIPDCRGRVRAGQDDMGGSSANRLTGSISGLDGDILGAVGGVESTTLSISQMPYHNHGGATGYVSANHTHQYLYAANTSYPVQSGYGAGVWSGVTYLNSGSESANHYHSISAQGDGLGHTNMQPTIIFNTIIYAGV
jgi:microcystin-dependent protein